MEKMKLSHPEIEVEISIICCPKNVNHWEYNVLKLIFLLFFSFLRTLCHWWKCSRNAVYVSLPVPWPVVFRLHYRRLLRKEALVCCWNIISNWTLGILPGYLWVLPCVSLELSERWPYCNILNIKLYFVKHLLIISHARWRLQSKSKNNAFVMQLQTVFFFLRSI